jgi:hypothetical protein
MSPTVSAVPAPVFLPRPDRPRFSAVATAGWRRGRTWRTRAWRTETRLAGPASDGAQRAYLGALQIASPSTSAPDEAVYAPQ